MKFFPKSVTLNYKTSPLAPKKLLMSLRSRFQNFFESPEVFAYEIQAVTFTGKRSSPKYLSRKLPIVHADKQMDRIDH